MAEKKKVVEHEIIEEEVELIGKEDEINEEGIEVVVEVEEESRENQEEIVEETIEVVGGILAVVNTESSKKILGVVSNCSSLNVRKQPSVKADILFTIKLGTEVNIDMEGSTSKFYKIIFDNDIEGFCMKDFIEV